MRVRSHNKSNRQPPASCVAFLHSHLDITCSLVGILSFGINPGVPFSTGPRPRPVSCPGTKVARGPFKFGPDTKMIPRRL